MRRANDFARKIINWVLLATGLQPHLPEMPHLQSFYEQLLELIEEAKQLDTQQEAARGQLRELTRRRQDVEGRGENLRARIAAHLRATFGFTSEQLVQFGINPRPRVTRRRQEPEPEQPENVSPDAK